MELLKASTAGTLESSDVYIVLEPNSDSSVNIKLDSVVEKQFGDEIRKLVYATLEKYNVKGINLDITDKGALDCTILARLTTVLKRAGVPIEQ